MTRVFRFVPLLLNRLALNAFINGAHARTDSAMPAKKLPCAMATLFPVARLLKIGRSIGPSDKSSPATLNRFVLVCLAALSSHVALADQATTLPPLPPLADPPTHEQITGKFVWADLFAEDDEKARQFYSELLGWKWRTIGSGADAYQLAENDGVPIAGLVQRDRQKGEVAGGIWIAYLSVPDARASADQIVSLGGKTLVPVVKVNGRGDFAIFSDPVGALFGVVRSDSGDPADYQSRIGDWIWINLAVNDAAQAADFYAAVGNYDTISRWDVDTDDDLLLSSGGYARAGVSGVDDDRPPVWVPFVRVADAADAAARAQALGAALLLPPRDDVPGGDLAVIADPTGAVVGLMTWDYEETSE
jgi:predicted enzyme related to lactoylglutathione lyase